MFFISIRFPLQKEWNEIRDSGKEVEKILTIYQHPHCKKLLVFYPKYDAESCLFKFQKIGTIKYSFNGDCTPTSDEIVDFFEKIEETFKGEFDGVFAFKETEVLYYKFYKMC